MTARFGGQGQTACRCTSPRWGDGPGNRGTDSLGPVVIRRRCSPRSILIARVGVRTISPSGRASEMRSDSHEGVPTHWWPGATTRDRHPTTVVARPGLFRAGPSRRSAKGENKETGRGGVAAKRQGFDPVTTDTGPSGTNDRRGLRVRTASGHPSRPRPPGDQKAGASTQEAGWAAADGGDPDRCRRRGPDTRRLHAVRRD